MNFINDNIIVISSTEGDGIIMLIRAEDVLKEKVPVRCVTVDDKEVTCFTDMQKAMTFNAFIQCREATSLILKERVNQKLTDQQVESINQFLK